ncbi:hypothetical protein [Rhizobium herbae]|uniref:Uncharacterized protein n=1 Tax=Rhizobium herbae TaxID=508661 RepID=A0ABS4EPW0_9HYPH|nr:hypothetical protein [Rhizobium herbae]
MSLNVKWADFTRRKTVTAPVAGAAELAEIVELPLPPIFPVSKGIRLLGVTLSSRHGRTCRCTTARTCIVNHLAQIHLLAPVLFLELNFIGHLHTVAQP